MVVVVVAAGAVPQGLLLVAGVVVVVVQLAAQLADEAGRVPAEGRAAALGATHDGGNLFAKCCIKGRMSIGYCGIMPFWKATFSLIPAYVRINY